MDAFFIILAVAGGFVLAPIALIGHFIVKSKQVKGITPADEANLDELRTLAERLEDRMQAMERILDDEVPDWRSRRHDTY